VLGRKETRMLGGGASPLNTSEDVEEAKCIDKLKF
jgi:hypothetical protein